MTEEELFQRVIVRAGADGGSSAEIIGCVDLRQHDCSEEQELDEEVCHGVQLGGQVKC